MGVGFVRARAAVSIPKQRHSLVNHDLEVQNPFDEFSSKPGGTNGEDGIGGGLGRLVVGHPAQPLKPQHPILGSSGQPSRAPLSFSQGCTVGQVSGSIHPRTRAWNLQGFTPPQNYDCRQLRCGVRSLSLLHWDPP